MSNTKNNKEDSLLAWLSNSLEKTQTELDLESKCIAYWESDEPDYQDDFGKITNDQREHYLSNARKEYNTLKYRLNWIELQIEKIKK